MRRSMCQRLRPSAACGVVSCAGTCSRDAAPKALVAPRATAAHVALGIAAAARASAWLCCPPHGRVASATVAMTAAAPRGHVQPRRRASGRTRRPRGRCRRGFPSGVLRQSTKVCAETVAARAAAEEILHRFSLEAAELGHPATSAAEGGSRQNLEEASHREHDGGEEADDEEEEKEEDDEEDQCSAGSSEGSRSSADAFVRGAPQRAPPPPPPPMPGADAAQDRLKSQWRDSLNERDAQQREVRQQWAKEERAPRPPRARGAGAGHSAPLRAAALPMTRMEALVALGLPPRSDVVPVAELRAAYRAAARQAHPDRPQNLHRQADATHDFQRVHAAFELLASRA
mmetsp:Transcript_7448/g.27317  ORF Transcript_7448/g.27317 Transcript_7448/m.27317 type:complete len:344 (-) Transcript_7448:11-1042(-)